jgi:outer membrane protein OmpA-like peptidoglycan-associated protein/tetratricopeptide (TPR) repeat protein/protocatechuate 3,4-dioxygenase beta subunit
MAQEDLLKKADRSFNDLSYAQAVKHYEKAFEEGATDVHAQRRLAESYRKLRDFQNAVKWYAKVCASPEARTVDLYRYAEALRGNGRYEEADIWLDQYGRTTTADSRVKRQSGAADKVPILLVDPIFEGDAQAMMGNSEFSDMAPVQFGDALVFASARPLEGKTKRKYAWDDTPFLDLYQAAVGSGGTLGAITPFSEDLNTRYHESDPTFSADGKEMYFTRNSYYQGRTTEGEDGVNNLQIHRALLQDGKWVGQEPFAYNNEEYSMGHPNLAADGSKLYLTSNMPGGMGGTDIYVCEKQADGTWGALTNMGPAINTEGDEMFPRSYGKHTLFFSSDGQQGMGGLDLFMTDLKNDAEHQIINLGSPINSMFDDFAVALAPDGSDGYFTSARPGGAGRDDLYAFTLDHPFKEQVTLYGRVIDKVGRLAVKGVVVSVLDASGRELRRAITDEKGEYEITMVPQKATLRSHFADGPVVLVPIEQRLFEMEHPELPEMAVEVLKKWEFIGDGSYLKEFGENGPEDLSAKPLVTVRGDVVDKMDGRPLKGIMVNVLDPEGRVLRSAVTDKYGQYQVTMRHGQNSLQARFADGDAVVVPVDPALFRSAAPSLPTIALEVGLKDGSWAHIADATTGEPMQDVDVIVTNLRSGGTEMLQGRTDENGYLKALTPNGSIADLAGHEVFISKDGFFPRGFRVSEVKGEDAVHTISREMQVKLEPIREGADIRKALDMDPIYFDYKKAEIRTEAEDVLEMVAFIMNNSDGMEIELAAHTDSRASDAYNTDLSQQRANAARDFLIDRGVVPERIKAVGHGESRLINGCADGVDCDEDEHQMNRRTEFIVTKVQ